MKNYDETINSVFERINEYEVEKKHKRKIVARTVTSLCCFCLVALLGFGVWQSDLFKPMPPTVLDGSSNIGELDDSSLQATDKSDNKNYPMEAIQILSLSQGGLEEFAADMYRPDGYSDNIGSVLAIKMSMISEESHLFPVIITIEDERTLDELINVVNNTLSEPIALDEIKQVSIADERITNKFYLKLTSEQIKTLAEKGLRCSYVGSGEGQYKNMSWDTENGINTYCELHGDMYIFEDKGYKHSPDLGIE